MVKTGAYQFDGSQQTSLSYSDPLPSLRTAGRKRITDGGRDGARGRRDKRLSLELWLNRAEIWLRVTTLRDPPSESAEPKMKSRVGSR